MFLFFKAGNMAKCPNFSMTAWQHDTDAKRVIVMRIGCGMWSCPVCSVRMQSEWRKHLRKRLPEISDKWWLITFTAPAWVNTHEKSLELIRKGLDLFFKRARRIWEDLEYVRVYETHKTRHAVHVHIIASGLSEHVRWTMGKNGKRTFRACDKRDKRKGFWNINTFVKSTAIETGMGYIAQAKPIPSDRSVYYVTKYLTKDMQQLTIKSLRHVQTSQGIGSPKKKDTGYWHTGRRLFKHDMYGDEALYDADRKVEINEKYWRDNTFYPPNTD